MNIYLKIRNCFISILDGIDIGIIIFSLFCLGNNSYYNIFLCVIALVSFVPLLVISLMGLAQESVI